MDGEGAGKGDTPRPVDKKVYDQNFDNIDWHRDGEKIKERLTENYRRVFESNMRQMLGSATHFCSASDIG